MARTGAGAIAGQDSVVSASKKRAQDAKRRQRRTAGTGGMRLAAFWKTVRTVEVKMVGISKRAAQMREKGLAGANMEERRMRTSLTEASRATRRHLGRPRFVKGTCGARLACGKASSATGQRRSIVSALPRCVHGGVLAATCRPPNTSSKAGEMACPRKFAMGAAVISDASTRLGTDANVGARDAPTAELEDASAAE